MWLLIYSSCFCLPPEFYTSICVKTVQRYTIRVNRSLTVLLLSDDLLVPFMILNVENNHSNFPLEEGRENKSSASNKTLDHSDAVGALKRRHKSH